MNKRSFSLAEALIGVLAPSLGLVLGLVGAILCAIFQKDQLALPLIVLVPCIYSLIFGVLNLVSYFVNSEKTSKIIDIIFHAVNVVANALCTALMTFVAIVAGLFGAVIAAIIGGIAESSSGQSSGEGSGSQEATDEMMKSLMSIFMPIALVFFLLTLIGIAGLVLSIVNIKKERKLPGKIAGELSLFGYALAPIAGIGISILTGHSNPGIAFLFSALCVGVNGFGLMSVSSSQIARNSIEHGIFDTIKRIAFMMLLFGVVAGLFYPQYLSANTTSQNVYMDGYSIFFGIIALTSLAFIYVSKYVKPVFFLSALGTLFGIANMMFMFFTLNLDMAKELLPLPIVALVLVIIGGLGVFIIDLLKKVNVIKTAE